MNTIIEKIRAEIERRIETYKKGYANGDDRRADALELLLSFLDTLQEQPVDLDNKTIMEEIRKLGCYPSEFDVARRFYELGKQSKQTEWTEKDKSILNNIVAYKYLNVDDLEWLKDIPNRIQQSKPTTAEGLEEEIKRWLKEGEITDTRYDDYNDNDIESTARHFAQWGAEHRGSSEIPKDLEEAAKKYADDTNPTDSFYEAFKEGALWMREQMMKEAVEGEVYLYHSYNRNATAIVVDIPKENLGDNVRIIICKKED